MSIKTVDGNEKPFYETESPERRASANEG